MRDYSPFFDQEAPEIPVDEMIASGDRSPSYELDAQAVFRCGHRFLVVEVSGCSCWPDRGGTSQTVCTEKSEVDRLVWPEVLQECQDNNWGEPR